MTARNPPARTPARARRTPATRQRSEHDALRQLSRLVALHDRRRREWDELDRLVAPLREAGLMVVLGEDSLLARLRARLDDAGALVTAIEGASDVDAQMEALEKLLGGSEWEAAGLTRPALEEKRRQQDVSIRQLQDEVDEWRKRIEPLRAAVDAALVENAPVRTMRGALVRIDGLVGQAERALRDKRYADVSEPLGRLAAAGDDPASLLPAIEAKVENAKRFNRQADVLLLRAPLDGRHVYTVLLRTPSEPGSHGINIQDSSCLVDQDREYVRDVISKVTAAVDAGIARGFRGTAEPQGETTPDAAEPAGAPQPAVEGRREWPAATPAGAVDGQPEDLGALIREVGNVMFRLFMPDRMREYLASTPCSLTVATNDLELPWELMHDEDLAAEATADEEASGFLCLQRPVARMPMGRAFPRIRRRPPLQKTKPRFLLIYADPAGNLPSAGREVKLIEQALKERWNRPGEEQIEIEVLSGETANGKRLNRALLDGSFDVIHFAGHAHFEEMDPDLSGLLLHDEEVFLSQKIQRFVEGRPLVFLNACETGRTANEQEPQAVGKYFWKPAEGLASAFLYGGALGCVGSLWPIYDEPAARFAVSFYNEVLEGQMIGEAMRVARRTSKRDHPDSISWASFVLYGDPTFRLVR